MIDFNKILKILNSSDLKYIIYGILSTLILAIFGTFIGLVLGIFLAYGKNININETDKRIIKIVKKTCLICSNLYSTIFRGTPMMVQALIFKYGCQYLGLNWEIVKFPKYINNEIINGWLIAGLIVITLNTAAYMGEIIKSGLNGVDIGQQEGARSLGMSKFQTSILIILPQAIKNCLPTIANEFIVNIKDSSVLNVIAVTELFYRFKDIATTSYAFLECYLLIALIYLILTILSNFLFKLLENKLNGKKIKINLFKREML